MAEDYRKELNEGVKRALAALLGAVIAVLGLLVADLTSGPEAPVERPAALPAGTGIDAEGIAPGYDLGEVAADGMPTDGKIPENAQVEPDVDEDAPDVEKKESADDGVGGEIYLTSPIWDGSKRLNAGAYYPSSGRAHHAYDIGLTSLTPIYAPFKAKVVGTNDGVGIQPEGVIWSSNSNWVLLCTKLGNGREALTYFQHLAPGLKVERGQTVTKGQQLAQSDNTGNSTGSHLHLSANYLRSGQKCSGITQGMAAVQRYDYLNYPSLRIYEPSKVYGSLAPKREGRTVEWKKLKTVIKKRGKGAGTSWVRKNLGSKHIKSKWTSGLSKLAKKRLGKVNCTTIKALGEKKGITWKAPNAVKWQQDCGRTITLSKIQKIAKTRGTGGGQAWIRSALDVKQNAKHKWTKKLTKKYASYQKSLGYRGKDADGIPGCTTLKKLQNKGKYPWSTKC